MAQVMRPLAAVTGASSGIGLEIARELAKHGYDLVVCAEDARITDVAERLRALGGRVTPVQADLATFDGCDALMRAVDGDGKPLEAIALNAGVGVGGRFVGETRIEEELRLIALNCVAVVRLAKWAAENMVARGRGRILITSSIAGLMPSPFEAVYGASKAFDLSLSASLHKELEDSGVTVTALLPGPTDTEFFTRAGMDDTRAAEQAKKNAPADVARMGVEAMLAGKERVVAGNLTVKLQGLLARFTPESLKASMHAHLSEPGGRSH